MADLRITELAALSSGDLAAGDFLAVADISASETKKITVTDFTGKAVTLIADATIPGAKILFGTAEIAGTALEDGAVDTLQLAADAVTAAKLADESSVDLVTTLPASGAFVGQIALDTDDSKIYCWNGSTWVSIKAAGSINTVIGGTAGVVNVTVTTTGDSVTVNTTLDATGAAAQVLAGPTAGAGAVTYRTIAAGDLPTATTGAKGAVVVNGNGLTMSGDTVVINNTVTAETSNYHVVQYNANGLVTGGRQIIAADVPVATASSIGVVKPGSGLGVDGAGTLDHTNSITPASAAKVTVSSPAPPVKVTMPPKPSAATVTDVAPVLALESIVTLVAPTLTSRSPVPDAVMAAPAAYASSATVTSPAPVLLITVATDATTFIVPVPEFVRVAATLAPSMVNSPDPLFVTVEVAAASVTVAEAAPLTSMTAVAPVEEMVAEASSVMVIEALSPVDSRSALTVSPTSTAKSS
jgi:hypothetical protein